MNDFLRKLESEIAVKKAALAELQASLAELETTARVYKRLQGGGTEHNGVPQKSDGQPSVPKGQTELGESASHKKSAKEFVVEILADHGPMHYKEVAEEAIRRGFESIQSNDPGAPRRTIMSVLYRTSESFEAKGKGIFTLKK